jgi:hypothetical protein
MNDNEFNDVESKASGVALWCKCKWRKWSEQRSQAPRSKETEELSTIFVKKKNQS